MRLEDLGEDLYKNIRNSTDDIEKIAKNTGWDKNKIEDIKNHMFKNEHLFDDGGFAPWKGFKQCHRAKRFHFGTVSALRQNAFQAQEDAT